jgi:hypothetical protein
MTVPPSDEGPAAGSERRTPAVSCAGLDVDMFDAFLDSLWHSRSARYLHDAIRPNEGFRPHRGE